MKILVITNLFPNSIEPTRGIFNFQQFKTLASLPGVEIKIIAPVPWFPKLKIKKEWYNFSLIPNKEMLSNFEVYHPRYVVIPKILRALDGIAFFFGIMLTVKEIQKEFSFDCIFATWAYPDGFGSALIAQMFKKPFFIKVHGSDIDIHIKSRFRKKMVACALQKSAKIISVSQNLKGKMVSLGIAQDKIAVIPNGVNTELFKPLDQIECRKTLGLPLDKKIILFVGNLKRDKGVIDIVDAVFRLSGEKKIDAFLAIVGDGPLKEELEKKAADLSLLPSNILLSGSRPHNEIPVWMNASDVFCLPSYHEGCPNVILEALACRKPVVATTVGAIPELINKLKCGNLVPTGNVNMLEKALLEVLSSSNIPEQIGEFVDNRSWKNNAENVFSELETVIKNSVLDRARLNIIYHHRTRGQGAEGVHICSIVNALAELGHCVSVISPPGVEPFAGQASYKKRGISIGKIWRLVSRCMPQTGFELLEFSYNFVGYFKMSKVLARQNIDFIYERYAFFCWIGVYLAKMHKIPVIIEVNEISGIGRVRGQVFIALSKWIEEQIFKHADALIVVSNFLKQQIANKGINSHKIYVIPNAVDTAIFKPYTVMQQSLKSKFDLNSEIIVGFVGGFDKWHNFEFLLNGFADVIHRNGHNVRLILVGDGPMYNYIEQQVIEKNLHGYVILAGRVAHRDIPHYIDIMDICIIPESNEYRSPIKLFEYMAMGKAVVAPRLVPIEDVATHNKDIVLFEPENKESFKNALRELIDDAGKRELLGRAAMKTVQEKHTWQRNAEKIIEIASGASLPRNDGDK